MLDANLELTIDTVDRTWTTVSKQGYDNIRIETTVGVDPNEKPVITGKHTINVRSSGKPNRHMVRFANTQLINDKSRNISCHIVLENPQYADPIYIMECAAVAAAYLSDPDNVSSVLLGSA